MPEVPEIWSTYIDGLMDQEPRLSAQIKGFQRQHEELDTRMENLPVDEEVLTLESRIVQLAEPRSRHVTAEADLPERRAKLREHDAAIRTIVLRLRDTPDVFQARLEEDDEATATRLAHATELAAVRQVSDGLRDNASEAERGAEDLARVRKQQAQVLEEVATAVQSMRDSGALSLRRDTSLAKVRAWIQLSAHTSWH